MIRIYTDFKIAVIGVAGTPTLIKIKKSIEALLEHPDHIDGMDEIWDFSKASMISFNENELRILSDFVKKRLSKLAKRTALIIAEDVDYGIGRMWMTYAEIMGANQERELFRNIEDAIEWLTSQKV